MEAVSTCGRWHRHSGLFSWKQRGIEGDFWVVDLNSRHFPLRRPEFQLQFVQMLRRIGRRSKHYKLFGELNCKVLSISLCLLTRKNTHYTHTHHTFTRILLHVKQHSNHTFQKAKPEEEEWTLSFMISHVSVKLEKRSVIRVSREESIQEFMYLTHVHPA